MAKKGMPQKKTDPIENANAALGISISSLLGPKDSNDGDDDLVPISSSEMGKSPEDEKRVIDEEEVITIDDSDENAPEPLTRDKFKNNVTTLSRTASGKIDIKSILTNNDTESPKDTTEVVDEKKPAVKKRKPRAAKKEAEAKVETAKPKRAPRGSKKKAAEEAKAKKEQEANQEQETTATVTADSKKDSETSGSADKKKDSDPVKTTGRARGKSSTSTNKDAKETAKPENKGEDSKDSKEEIKESKASDSSTKASREASTIETPQKESSYVSPAPRVSSPYVLQSQTEQKISKPNDIKNLMNEDVDVVDDKPKLLPSPLPNNDLKASTITTASTTTTGQTTTPKPTSSTTAAATPPVKPKAKASKKPSTENKEVKPKAKAAARKKDDTKKTTPQEPKAETPVPLTFNQIQNQNLIKPDPKANESLPPPKVIEVQKSPTQEITPQPDSKPTEPIIVLHVPLKPPTTEEQPTTADGYVQVGATQVVFNVLKMAEDKYGWRNLHPEASKYALELMNDEDIDIDDDDDDDDEKEEEEPEQKVDGRRLQKGKPKIGQYDKEDPFIDDSEMVWEEQRASTKDGFFVFYGPLVEEGKSAKIERADGTIKRNRKRPAAGSAGGAGSAKKRQTVSKQTTPKLVPIAPAANAAVTATGGGNSTATSATNSNTVSRNGNAAPTGSTSSASTIDIAPKTQ